MPDLKNKTPKNKPIYRFDPLLGYWGIPNLRQKIRPEENPSIEIEVCHNAQGMREALLSLPISSKTILCVGGSHTWGAGITNEERYSDLLARRSGRQVVNMGHCSLGIDQIAVAILKRSKELNPGIIVIEQYPLAVVRLLRNYLSGGYIKPHFFLDEQGDLKLEKVPSLARFSVFRKLIGSYYSYRKEFQEFQKGIDVQEGYDRLADPMFLYWKISQYDYLYVLLEKIILVIRDHCRQNNIRLLFGLGAIWQQFAGRSQSRLVDYDLPRKRFKNILDKSGVAYVDMADALLREHSKGSPVIFDDGHINAKGHDILAAMFQKDLTNRGWL